MRVMVVSFIESSRSPIGGQAPLLKNGRTGLNGTPRSTFPLDNLRATGALLNGHVEAGNENSARHIYVAVPRQYGR